MRFYQKNRDPGFQKSIPVPIPGPKIGPNPGSKNRSRDRDPGPNADSCLWCITISSYTIYHFDLSLIRFLTKFNNRKISCLKNSKNKKIERATSSLNWKFSKFSGQTFLQISFCCLSWFEIESKISIPNLNF